MQWNNFGGCWVCWERLSQRLLEMPYLFLVTKCVQALEKVSPAKIQIFALKGGNFLVQKVENVIRVVIHAHKIFDFPGYLPKFSPARHCFIIYMCVHEGMPHPFSTASCDTKCYIPWQGLGRAHIVYYSCISNMIKIQLAQNHVIWHSEHFCASHFLY